MNTGYESSACRRSYIRFTYDPQHRPALRVADERFDIIDISESGIRFDNSAQRPLAPTFRARIALLTGGTIDITADVQWQQNGEVGISLADAIPAAVIREEQRRAILQDM